MTQSDRFKEQKLQQLQLLMYLIPVVGCLPAFWSLSQRQGSRQQQSVSRLAVTLMLLWLLSYGLLWIGSQPTSELLTLRILYLNGLITSGYFLVCLSLMVSVSRGKLPRLPGISRLAEEIGRRLPL